LKKSTFTTRLKWKLAKIKRKRTYERISKIALVAIALILIYVVLSGNLFRSCAYSVGIGTLLMIASVLRFLLKSENERPFVTMLFTVPVVLYWIFIIAECFT
jgi:uncharacterized membrane protein